MRRLLAAARRRIAVLLVPLTMVPFGFVAPSVVHAHFTFQRKYHSGPLPLPAVRLSVAELASYPAFASDAGGVPVLVWHGIGDARDGYTVGQAAFERQLELLRHLGFHAISMRQYQAFRAGDPSGLPSRPVLLTFDDGRLDSYRGADKALQHEGMRAAMFVITARIESGDPSFLSWAELHTMARTGRWDVEPHAAAGHTLIPVDDHGGRAPFYAARRYTRSAGRESLADWEMRVSEDLYAAKQKLAAQGFAAHGIAVPYGDAGDDPQVQQLLTGLLTRQFGTYFVQARDPDFTHPGSGAASRYEIHTSTGLAQLYGWLREHTR